MLFEETMLQYEDSIKDAVEELFKNAYSNQVNETDLLLVLQNGIKQRYSPETLKRLKTTQYSIGPDFIGLRYSSFYNFINQYRTIIFKKSDHLKELNKQHSERSYLYHYFIEQELLIYLKFWETDLILRRIYNLSRLARGLDYCWDYNQEQFNERRKIVKVEIQKNLQGITPKFCQLLEDIYNRQLRNAIAHSQYYLLYDEINLTNRNDKPYYKIDSIHYNIWEVLFHKNVLFYNYLIHFFNEYSRLYQDLAHDKQNGLLIVFPEKTIKGNNKTGWTRFNENLSRWNWADN
jgi:hypothetical protein